MKADLIQGFDVGGVGDGDKKPVAALVEGQGVMTPDDVFLDQLDHIGVDIDGVDVNQRHAEFHAGGVGDVATVHQLVFDQAGNQRYLLVEGILERALGVLLRQQTVHNQPAREAGQRNLVTGNSHL